MVIVCITECRIEAIKAGGPLVNQRDL